MSNRALTSKLWGALLPEYSATYSPPAAGSLPVAITRAASKQTYYTVRLLVDRNRTANAYRAYAYFRWLDDSLDSSTVDRRMSLSIVKRQEALIDCAYRREWPDGLSDEEQMLFDLVASDDAADSGLHAYIHHMMAVMAFDADRRGRLISEEELAAYTYHLAAAVTEALHYFIGHDQPAPMSDAKYSAAMGAHIIHMLRDTVEDTAAGYFNIPGEVLADHRIEPDDIASEPYRAWVKSRVELARRCFDEGADYLARVENRRCRLAGFAYMARFQGILQAIERENYILRPDYHERKSLGSAVKMLGSTLAAYAAS
jgi:phytoene/squalene synthetase